MVSTGRFKATKVDEEPKIRSAYIYDEQAFMVQASEGGSVYRYERDTEGFSILMLPIIETLRNRKRFPTEEWL